MKAPKKESALQLSKLLLAQETNQDSLGGAPEPCDDTRQQTPEEKIDAATKDYFANPTETLEPVGGDLFDIKAH